MFVSHHTLKWTRTCRSHGRHPHAHTAHFLLNRHITLLAARLAEGVAGIEYDDDRPDLSEYDIAFTADVGVQEGGR